MFFLSMLPVSEIRGGIIAARAYDMNWLMGFSLSFIGNMLPIPFILLFIRKIFAWMRRSRIPLLSKAVDWCMRRAEKNSEKVRRYEMLGLWLLVSIPLPGTGAWTGALVASIMDIRLRKSLPTIAIGVVTAGVIMLTLLYFIPELFI